MSLYLQLIQAANQPTMHDVDIENTPFQLVAAKRNLGTLAVYLRYKSCGLPMLDLVGNCAACETFLALKSKLVAK